MRTTSTIVTLPGINLTTRFRYTLSRASFYSTVHLKQICAEYTVLPGTTFSYYQSIKYQQVRYYLILIKYTRTSLPLASRSAIGLVSWFFTSARAGTPLIGESLPLRITRGPWQYFTAYYTYFKHLFVRSIAL